MKIMWWPIEIFPIFVLYYQRPSRYRINSLWYYLRAYLIGQKRLSMAYVVYMH